MTTTITFVGAKGGVGTSTVAALVALRLARSNPSVRLSASGDATVEDLAALLAVPTPPPGELVEVVPGLTLADHPDLAAANVIDGGTDCFSDHHGVVYVVLRNDYLSLRRALNVPQTTAGLVVLIEPKRCLTPQDVAEVLPHPIVAEIGVHPAVARAIDAGLLATARHLHLDLEGLAKPTALR